MKLIHAWIPGYRRRQAKKEILAILQHNRPLGIPIPLVNEELASIATEMVKNNHNLMLLTNAVDGLLLVFRQDWESRLSRGMTDALAGSVGTKDNLHD